MKPALGMEEGKTVYTVTQPSAAEVKTTTKTRSIAVAACVLVSLVIVSVVIFVGVYFGAHMTKNAYQEAWKTLRDREGRMMEEKVTKTEDTVEFDVPNTVQIVYDYRHNISVERYTDLNTKLRTPCYVRYINKTSDPRQDIDMENSENMLNDVTIQSTQQWLFTKRTVPSYLTSSPRVQELCRDTDIFWMDAVQQSDVQKRDTYTAICYTVAYLWYNGNTLCGYYYRYCYMAYNTTSSYGEIHQVETTYWCTA